MNWNNISLIVLGLAAFVGAFVVALWVSLVIWTFRDMRARTRDAFAQLLASLMVLVLGPFGIVLYFILRPRETLAEKYERSLEEEALLQDIEERHICPGCKQPIDPDYVLCPICHTRLRQPCIHCGRLIHPRWSVCPYCAESQRPVPGVERAGRVTLLDLEREAPRPATMGELSDDGRRAKDRASIEPVATTQSKSEGQLPSKVEEEPSPDASGDEADIDWEPAESESTEDALKTRPLDIERASEGANQRPLSLFRRR
jgi:RNA polymerase subunit RPABC4/transcription elongation factor Spt4